MADSKLADLTADASPTSDDLIYTVNSPGGTPADRKVTLANLASALAGMAGMTGAFVAQSTYDANTILKADVDNTPEALTVAEDRIVGRVTGGEITALTAAQVGSLFSGTAFPGSPSDRQTFYRTDRDIQYFYDLANTRWLSVQEQTVSFPAETAAVDSSLGISAAANAGRLPVPYRGTYSILITRFQVRTLVPTTNDGTKYWTIKLNRADSADSDVQIGTTMDTSADTASTNHDHFISPNVVCDSTARQLKLRVDKVSTPGNLNVQGLLSYRLVG